METMNNTDKEQQSASEAIEFAEWIRINYFYSNNLNIYKSKADMNGEGFTIKPLYELWKSK